MPLTCYFVECATVSLLFLSRNSARSSIGFMSLLYFPPLQKMNIFPPPEAQMTRLSIQPNFDIET
jgi:hypothetical protein